MEMREHLKRARLLTMNELCGCVVVVSTDWALIVNSDIFAHAAVTKAAAKAASQ